MLGRQLAAERNSAGDVCRTCIWFYLLWYEYCDTYAEAQSVIWWLGESERGQDALGTILHFRNFEGWDRDVTQVDNALRKRVYYALAWYYLVHKQY